MGRRFSMRRFYLLLAIAIVFAYGCSGGGSQAPLIPDTGDNSPLDAASSSISHTNWGLWQFVADPAAETLDVIQLRTGAIHLNALKFVNEPAYVYLTVESLEFSGNIIDTDIGLRHPFLGLNQFTGFDVKGILISDGSLNGFTDPDVNIPGMGDTRLLNPDGYTRWWNPNEFPDIGTIFGYIDGVLGQPYDIAGFTATVNAYKYFCDDLDDPDDPLSDIDISNRGMFSAGQKNVRHYTIEMSSGGLVFNYAVDANWKFPVGAPPYQVPDDFSELANQPETYRIAISESDNSLYFDPVEGAGGDLHLSIDVYDWFDADLHTVKAEWPGFASQVASTGPVNGGPGYSTYEVDLIGCTPTSAGDQDILISIECETLDYQNIIPGSAVSSYYLYTTDVADEAPATAYNIAFSDEGVLEEIYAAGWNDISPALCIETDDEIKMAYSHNMLYDPTPEVMHYARSYACKSNDGLNWYGFQASFYTSGGYTANHGDCVKIAASTEGNSWRTLSLWNCLNMTFSAPFSAATELFPPPVGIDGAHVTTYITRASEIIQDADGYVYIMGDKDNQLQFKKSEVPYYLTQGPHGAIWGYGNIPIHFIGTGYFSRARSIELAPDDNMYFVYYVDDTANTIQLAYNTDSTGLTWDASTVVYDGSATGTTGAHDPGLDIDPDGDFHVTFIRESGGNDQLCYVHSTDGASWTDPVVIAEMASKMNDDPICFFEFDELDFLAAVWQAGTHIYVSFSYDGGQNWADATQVDSLLDENVQPDFVVTSDGVMHIAWAAKNGTHYDIHYRNAWLEES